MPLPDLFALCAAFALQAPAQSSGWEHFPVFVWTVSDKPIELVDKFGGACVQRLDDPSWLEDRKLDWFVFNAPGRDDLHLEREGPAYQRRWRKWYDTRDPALLVREPCLLQSSTLERLQTTLDKTLASLGARRGLGISLGDEVGLTPGGVPEDVCQCATCEQAWSAWWPTQLHGDSTRKMPALREITTEATLKALADGDTTAIGPWLTRRHFHQANLLGVLDGLAQRVRAKSPGMGIGLLGISGQTAFDGVAVERVLPSLDFFECYRVGDARELALTLRKPEQRALLTVFPDPRGPDFTAWQAWEHWMRGGDGLVIWSESDLRKSPELTARLARAVRDIRDVVSKVGRFRPKPEGVALVHSADSIGVSWLREAQSDGATWPKRFPSYQEEHGELETSRKRWFELLENLGAMPGAVPVDRIDADTFKQFQLLVLDHAIVLDDSHVAGLKRFLSAGGGLCWRGELGWIDSSGRKVPIQRQAELRDVPNARIVRAPAAFDSYQGEHIDANWSNEWPQYAGLHDGPAQVGDPDQLWNWIRTWMRDGQGFVCAALPKPRSYTGESKSNALPNQVVVNAESSWRVEWIHPTPDEHGVVSLSHGDAAVFRLLPKN